MLLKEGDCAMQESCYPFPQKESAIRMLEQDHCYHKIAPPNRMILAERAWTIGSEAAEHFLKEQPVGQPLNFSRIMREQGLTVATEDRDYVLGNTRYFADYQTKTGIVTVYRGSVSLWAAHNGMSYRQAENLILMHEYFHYLEHTRIGYTSKIHPVYMVKLFGRSIGSTGLASLSEIAANAFAQAVYPYALLEGVNEPVVLPQTAGTTVTGGSESDRFGSTGLSAYGWFSIALTVLTVVFNGLMLLRLPSVMALPLQAGEVFYVSKWVFVLAFTMLSVLFLSGSVRSRTAQLQISITQAVFVAVNIWLAFAGAAY